MTIGSSSMQDVLARALLRGDFEDVSQRLVELRRGGALPSDLAWAEYVASSNQGRSVEAEAILPSLLAPDGTTLTAYDASGGALPEAADPRWRRDGSGVAQLSTGALRLVSLGGSSSVYEIALPELDNAAGTWIEFVVRRWAGTDGDCRIELTDGSASETAVVNSASVSLMSTGTSARFHASANHLYGLWVGGQTSRLYADGQLVLESRGLRASTDRKVRFGAYATGADAESFWRLVRVSCSASRSVPGHLPAPWGAGVWVAAVDAATSEGDAALAASYLQQARLAQPDDPSLRERLTRLFVDGAGAGIAMTTLRQLVLQLPLADRAYLAAQAGVAEHSELLLASVGLGVRFRSGAGGDRSLGQFVLETLRLRRQDDRARYFWAIRGVSVEVRAGDLVAVIGRNGAGKTTLLNTLADLIEPDEGRVDAHARPLLLSAGVGFLSGLTGRENVLLSGLYLGLTRREIRERFDEIVEFAELWDAINRPVRTYSAGMTSRLQFAIATTIDPELLLLDELLGAGDAAFTEKAQTRMHQQLRRSKAVLIATHDLHFVRTQCTSAILLEGGCVLYQGPPEAAVVQYQDLLIARPKRTERVTD